MQRQSEANRRNTYVEDFDKVGYALDNINWNFPSKIFIHEGVQPFDCRKHHWFPATFIPEIPFTLIEILTHPQATVYDPFAGIGTTYFQALLLNRRPLATEICNVAVEFIKSLLVLFDPRINFESIQNKVMEIIGKFDPRVDYVNEVRDDQSVYTLVDELQPWYHEKTFNQLAYLFLVEHYCDDKPTKAAMRISISAILKRVCSQDRGWGCIADNVLPKQRQMVNKDALNLFQRHIGRLLTDLSHHLANVSSGYNELYSQISKQKTIFHSDARKDLYVSDSSVDLVVTSPSYPNMTDYVKSQRLSYYWLGLPVSSENSDLILEIGARRKRHREDSLTSYLNDSQRCNEILSRKVKEEGYACFVMPVFSTNSQKDLQRERVIHDVMLDLERLFKTKRREFERTIPAARRAHNIKWATLEQEKIYIFQKTR